VNSPSKYALQYGLCCQELSSKPHGMNILLLPTLRAGTCSDSRRRRGCRRCSKRSSRRSSACRAAAQGGRWCELPAAAAAQGLGPSAAAGLH
jgi:hypothetical protein